MSLIDSRPGPVESTFRAGAMELLPRGVGFFWNICILTVLPLSPSQVRFSLRILYVKHLQDSQLVFICCLASL